MSVVLGGGFYTLGSSSDVGPLKIVYMALLIFCSLVSSYRLIINPPPWIRPFKKTIVWGIAFLLCMIIGTMFLPTFDLLTTIRQSVFYLLVILSPIIGLDAGRDMRPRFVLNMIGIIGTISAAGFAADWLERRNISSVEIGRFMLSSLVVPSLTFALALVCVCYAKGLLRILWFIPIIVIPAAMLVTGTRTNLIIYVAILGVIGNRKYMRVPLNRVLIITASACAGTLALIPLLASSLLRDPGFLMTRLQALLTVVGGDGQADESFRLRTEQYEYAWSRIHESPFFGFGPGFTADIPMDTPLVTIVKFGFVGSSILIIFLFVALTAIRHTARKYGYGAIHASLRGFILVFLALIPFGTPFEDRGFGFLLMLIFMGVSSFAQNEYNRLSKTANSGRIVPKLLDIHPRKLPLTTIDLRLRR
ncbi:hypothetical protein QO003_003598 [Arthrobacter silviterrae]|nr:hypothetical protein [Arthrobacter silviterrae]